MAKSAKKSKKAAKPAAKAKVKHPHVMDFRTPCSNPENELALAASFADGKTLDPNVGMMSATAYEQAMEANRVDGKSVPCQYSFIRRMIAKMTNATCLVSATKDDKGVKPKKSMGLNAKMTASMSGGDHVYVDPKSGDVQTLRINHIIDARDLVTDRKENVLTVGKFDFVVGTTETPAVHLIHANKTGSYGANIQAGKRAAFEGQDKILASLVGRFNNAAEVITLDDETDPGAQMAIIPNSLINAWGYFVKGDKRQTCAQIRKAVEGDDTTGMKFKVVYSPGGERLKSKVALNRSSLWAAIKPAMRLASTKRGDGDEATTALERFEVRKPRNEGGEKNPPQDCAWVNLSSTQRRVAPFEDFPFGVRSLQCGIVPVVHYGDDHKTKLVSFILGAWVGAKDAETSGQAHYRLHPDEYETEDDAQGETEAAPVTDTSTDAEVDEASDKVNAAEALAS